MTAQRIDELLALAALGELDDDEAAELDAALAADPDLAAELDADLDTAASIQASVSVEPPPDLKAQILTAIEETEQEREPETPDSLPVRAGVTSLAAARSRRRSTQFLTAAAAVVVLIAGGVFAFSRTATAPSDIDAVATADDAIERPLDDGELLGLSVVFSPSQNAFVLLGTDIPVLADSETYQLWLVRADGAESIGVFRPDDDGEVAARFDDSDPLGDIVGVTIEPAGGSDAPTDSIIAATS